MLRNRKKIKEMTNVDASEKSMHRGGYAVLFAVLVSSVALIIGISIFSTSVRELQLSSIARESQEAFFIADTGIECALEWDIKVGNIFARNSSYSPPAGPILCAGIDILPQISVPDAMDPLAATTTFTLNIGDGCAIVQVSKHIPGISPLLPSLTEITSRGRNECAAISSRAIERALVADY
jgi:hypothetical protein